MHSPSAGDSLHEVERDSDIDEEVRPMTGGTGGGPNPGGDVSQPAMKRPEALDTLQELERTPLDPEATAVVIGNGTYKGWRCVFCGNGRMEFAKGADRFAVKEDRYGRRDWMVYCWDQAKAEIDRREAEQTAGESRTTQ